jgi:hypothetical protein
LSVSFTPPGRTLLPLHRDHLHAGGLTDATIDAARLFSIDYDGPRYGLPARLSGVAFPYLDTEVRIDGRRMPLHRMRVDEACRRSPDRKYESPPKARIEDGLPFHVYVPPGVADHRKRTDAAVWITEGEKKALALTQHGQPCLGLPGVFLFTDPLHEVPHDERRLHPDLRRWHWRDRVVFVCFDADRLDNEQVAPAHERLCAKLSAEGARVRVVTVPDGPGVDDHLVRHGAGALAALIDGAVAWLPEVWRIQRIATDAPPTVAWAQLDAMRPFTRRLDPATLESVVEAAQRRLPALDPSRVARTLGLRATSDLAEIVVNGRQQREVIDDAWDALLGGEHGDGLFLYAGRLVRLARPKPGEAAVETVSADLLTALLRRSASWLRDKDGEARVDAPVPRDVAQDMLALPSHDVPMLDRILRTPALGEGGVLWRADGYHPAHRAFLDLPPALHDLTPMPLTEAVAWLRDELLVDFPFVAEVDRTHAVAALLLPFVRPAIDGPTPLHLIEAPTEGTGKSLLADALVRVATGRAAQPTTVPRGDDATRKKLTAILTEAPVAVVLDNLAGLVDSASLAALLTATTWADRRLGETQMLALPNHALWVATGNNPLLSRELARRAGRVRLDAGSATPWTGRTYRHANLGRWVDAHRRELVRAVLGLVQAWVEAGQPDAGASIGSYEAWARVVGGIVTHAGFSGFLTGDVAEVGVDPEEAEWAALVVGWGEAHGTAKVRASDLLRLARSLDLGIGAADRTEHATRARFGRGLGTRRGRVYGSWRVCDGFDLGRKQCEYWLAKAADSGG